MDFGKDYKFYDPNYIDHPNHNHLICVDCSKIVEFEDEHIDTLEDCITKRLGFSPAAQDRAHRGDIAMSCKRKGACSQRKRVGSRQCWQKHASEHRASSPSAARPLTSDS